MVTGIDWCVGNPTEVASEDIPTTDASPSGDFGIELGTFQRGISGEKPSIPDTPGIDPSHDSVVENGTAAGERSGWMRRHAVALWTCGGIACIITALALATLASPAMAVFAGVGVASSHITLAALGSATAWSMVGGSGMLALGCFTMAMAMYRRRYTDRLRTALTHRDLPSIVEHAIQEALQTYLDFTTYHPHSYEDGEATSTFFGDCCGWRWGDMSVVQLDREGGETSWDLLECEQTERGKILFRNLRQLSRSVCPDDERRTIPLFYLLQECATQTICNAFTDSLYQLNERVPFLETDPSEYVSVQHPSRISYQQLENAGVRVVWRFPTAQMDQPNESFTGKIVVCEQSVALQCDILWDDALCQWTVQNTDIRVDS